MRCTRMEIPPGSITAGVLGRCKGKGADFFAPIVFDGPPTAKMKLVGAALATTKK